MAQQLRDELELVKGASNEFDKELFLAGEITPVFFGTRWVTSALIICWIAWWSGPAPMPRRLIPVP
ncbi:hypothetical protein ACVXHA_30480 [Escherichia coli]